MKDSVTCGDCGDLVVLDRGVLVNECACGTEYNAFGQALRSDWESSRWDWDYEDD